MSRMRSGFFSKRMSESAERDFSLLVRSDLESGFKIEVEKRRKRWRLDDRRLQRNAIGFV